MSSDLCPKGIHFGPRKCTLGSRNRYQNYCLLVLCMDASFWVVLVCFGCLLGCSLGYPAAKINFFSISGSPPAFSWSRIVSEGAFGWYLDLFWGFRVAFRKRARWCPVPEASPWSFRKLQRRVLGFLLESSGTFFVISDRGLVLFVKKCPLGLFLATTIRGLLLQNHANRTVYFSKVEEVQTMAYVLPHVSQSDPFWLEKTILGGRNWY